MKQRILQSVSRARAVLRRVISGSLAFVFCAYLILDVLPVDAKAANIASGRLSNMSWRIDDSGILYISYYSTSDGSTVLPQGNPITNNPWYEYRDSISKIVIGEGFRSIQDGAFGYRSGGNPCTFLDKVTEIQLPSSIRELSYRALGYLPNVTSITLNDGLEAMGAEVFRGSTSIKSVTIPVSVTDFGSQRNGLLMDDAFYQYDETTGEWKEKSTSDSVFYLSGVEEVIFQDGTTNVQLKIFDQSDVTKIIIPESVETYTGRLNPANKKRPSQSTAPVTIYNNSLAAVPEGTFMDLPEGSKIYTFNKDLYVEQYNYDASKTQVLGYCKATFVDHDGTVLKEEYVPEGSTPTPPADPTRAADKTYKYAFTGWSNSVTTPMSSNVLFTAQYTPSYVDYTVKYTRDDGTLIKEDTHHYGEALTVPSAPMKDADDVYIYTFSGWQTTPPATCTGNATYVAQFAKTYRDYTITFEDHDGRIISSETYHYGDSVVVPEAPVRPSDGYNTYVFAGWDSPVVTVAGDTTYTAVYRSTAEKYSIIFVDHDGTVLSAGEFFYGDAITPPQDPVRASDAYADYIFRGWSLVPEAVKKDVTYTAQYIVIPKSYTVMYYDHNGRLLHLGSYHYGDTVHQPAVTSAPESEDEKLYVWKHSGWSPNFSETCVGHASYEAVFEKDYVEYTVTFQDYDGSTLSAQTYHYGDAIAAPTDPTRSADNTYTYSFAGWDKPVADTVTENVTYTAQYDAAYIEYEVIFKNYDGSTVSEQTYHYGDSLIVPPNPTRPSEGETGYAFSQWSPALSPTVTGNVIYLAEYTTGTAEYTVSFLDHDAYVLSSDTYLWRDLVAIPQDPYRLDDDTYSYRFIGWSPGVVNYVDGNATYIAQYEKKYREYTIRFENYDGSELSSALYHWGDTVIVPPNPTRPSEGMWNYSFIEWDKEVSPLCSGDAVYTAQYKTVSALYRVEFRDYDGTVLYLKTDCAYGDAITPPQDPVRAADAAHSYTFAGWDKTVADTVMGDVVYTATYAATPISSGNSSGGSGSSGDSTPPLDTDGDGIPDHLDEDDDNDGIPDSEDANPLVKDVVPPEEELPVEEEPAQIITGETSYSSETVQSSSPQSGTVSGSSSAAPPTEISATKDITVTFLDYYGRKARQVMLSGRTLDEPITDDVAAPPPVDRLVVDNDEAYVFTGWDMRVTAEKDIVYVSQYQPFVTVTDLSAMVDDPSAELAEETNGALDLRVVCVVGGTALLLSAGATYMLLIRKQNKKY